MPGVPPTSSTDPGRKSFAQLKRYVADYVQAPDDTEALEVSGAGINSGIDYLNHRVWHKQITSQAITLVAADADYSLESDFKDPRRAELLNASSLPQDILGYMMLTEMLVTRSPLTSSGDPSLYAIDYNSRLLLLDVPPSTGYVLRYPALKLWYYRRFPHFVNDDEVISAPAEFENFVGWYGRWEIASVRGRMQQAQVAYAHWMEMYRALVRDDTNTQTDWEH